jgi:hypothetical protein
VPHAASTSTSIHAGGRTTPYDPHRLPSAGPRPAAVRRTVAGRHLHGDHLAHRVVRYQRAGSCIRTPVRVQLRRRFGRGERGLPRSTRRSYAQLRITPIRLSPRLCGSELLHDPVTGSVRPPEWRVWYDGLVLDKGRPAERGPAAIILVHRPANMTRPDRVIPACAPRRRKWRSPTPRGRRAPRYHGIGSSRSVPASTAWRRRRLVSRTPVVAAGPTTRVGERRRGGATHEQCHSCHHRCNPALHDPHLQQQT